MPENRSWFPFVFNPPQRVAFEHGAWETGIAFAFIAVVTPPFWYGYHLQILEGVYGQGSGG